MDVNNRRDARGGSYGHWINPVREKGSRDRFWGTCKRRDDRRGADGNDGID